MNWGKKNNELWVTARIWDEWILAKHFNSFSEKSLHFLQKKNNNRRLLFQFFFALKIGYPSGYERTNEQLIAA